MAIAKLKPNDTAAEHLFYTNTGLAYKIASNYQKRNLRIDLDDMRQVSLMALWLAANRFDRNLEALLPMPGPTAVGTVRITLSKNLILSAGHQTGTGGCRRNLLVNCLRFLAAARIRWSCFSKRKKNGLR